MSNIIIKFLYGLFWSKLEDEKIQEALTHGANKKLAQIGDSVLNLVIYETEYKASQSTAGTMDSLRQSQGRRKKNQEILFNDKILTDYLLERDYIQNPQRKIGLLRADAYMEAIIGAIYLTVGLGEARTFIMEMYNLTNPKARNIIRHTLT